MVQYHMLNCLLKIFKVLTCALTYYVSDHPHRERRSLSAVHVKENSNGQRVWHVCGNRKDPVPRHNENGCQQDLP